MRSAALVLLAALALGAASSAAGPQRDYAGVALNVLAPGESGSISFDRNTTDQAKLYDGLTPLFGDVKPSDLTKYFKSERFGLGGEKPVRVERPRPGVVIERDGFDVPHITGKTRADVEFGAGWTTAEDRGILLELLRGPGAIAALDVPGLDAFSLALSGKQFVPSAETEAFLTAQQDVLSEAGAKGAQTVKDIDAYLAGINAYFDANGLQIKHWTRNDVTAVGTLIGAVFGAGGGHEAQSSELLSALERRLGPAKGRAVWDDLREQHDPETPVSVNGNFPYAEPPASATGTAVIDAGSLKAPSAVETHVAMSNALLVSAKRSATGHPLFVAGPQVGYFFPGILMELDLHGGGLDARGAAFPGVSFYVLIGRGKDYAWSATSAGSDVVDEYVETLCGDDTHYLYKGECRAMDTFDAGVLKGRPGEQDTPVRFRTTLHGPVVGYATVNGKRVAISSKRSTRGRELLSLVAFQDLNENRVTSARSFLRVMSQMELTFNWVYADDKDIALFSSGRLPIRAPGVDSGLPAIGTGEYEWRGFLPQQGHIQGINPAGGTIVNWNNKSGLGFAAADDNYTYGSVQRVDLLSLALAERRKHTLASVVAAMNKAATQDLRAVRVWPSISSVLKTGPAPSARAEQMRALLDAWTAKGSSRLDRDLDGKIDDPGAAIIDASWPKLADAVLGPVLGPLVDQLALLNARAQSSGRSGSAFFSGWWGYIDKDLRALLGRPVKGQFTTRFCGEGELTACRTALWAALDATGMELAASQGTDPAGWRVDATKERITFTPGILPETMRWTNRPTFQQVISFSSHRPR